MFVENSFFRAVLWMVYNYLYVTDLYLLCVVKIIIHLCAYIVEDTHVLMKGQVLIIISRINSRDFKSGNTCSVLAL